MVTFGSKQAAEAQAILADIESALRLFLKRAPRLKAEGCTFALELAARETQECLDAVRELRVTIFGQQKGGK